MMLAVTSTFRTRMVSHTKQLIEGHCNFDLWASEGRRRRRKEDLEEDDEFDNNVQHTVPVRTDS